MIQKQSGREKFETIKEQMIRLLEENKLNPEEQKFVAILIQEEIENERRKTGKDVVFKE